MPRLNHSQHILRYCKPNTLSSSGEPTAKSFELRTEIKKTKKPEEYLSVLWHDYFPNTNTIAKVVEYMKNNRFNIKSTGAFSKLNVGKMISTVLNGTNNRIKLEVKSKNIPHYGVYGFTIKENDIVPALIRTTVSKDDVYSIT